MVVFVLKAMVAMARGFKNLSCLFATNLMKRRKLEFATLRALSHMRY